MERNRAQGQKASAGFMLILLLVSLYPVIVYAQQTLVLQNPTNVSPNSSFRIRKNPVSGKVRPHKGVDLAIPCGTTIQTGGPVKCNFNKGGWGTYGVVDNGCGVKTLFGHLNGAPQSNACKDGNTYVISGGKTQPWAGGSTGCHLHYEVIMPDGTRVDPTVAWGKNLCDPKVREDLIKDAQAKLNGQAGGSRPQGGGGGGSAPSTNPTTGGGTGGGTGPTIPPYTPPPGGPPYTPAPALPHIYPADIPLSIDDFIPGTTTDNEVTGCATDTWRAMVNQSVLQTRREMLMNERYIAKADTILTYACFEDFYFYAGETLGIFSESRRWENAEIDIENGQNATVTVFMGPYSLDGAIVNGVDEAVYTYITNHFDHDFYGGLLTGQLPTLEELIDELEETLPGEEDGDVHGHALDQYGYPCGKMRQVWQMAKCHNVTDDPMFYRFEDLLNYDPRIYPHNYACLDSGITQNMINRAQNQEAQFDDVETHFDLLSPEDGECAPPIATGVKVTIREGAGRITEERTYDDAVCVTAGCSYQNSGGNGLGTCEIKQP